MGQKTLNSVPLLDLALFRVWVFRVSDFKGRALG